MSAEQESTSQATLQAKLQSKSPPKNSASVTTNTIERFRQNITHGEYFLSLREAETIRFENNLNERTRLFEMKQQRYQQLNEQRQVLRKRLAHDTPSEAQCHSALMDHLARTAFDAVSLRRQILEYARTMAHQLAQRLLGLVHTRFDGVAHQEHLHSYFVINHPHIRDHLLDISLPLTQQLKKRYGICFGPGLHPTQLVITSIMPRERELARRLIERVIKKKLITPDAIIACAQGMHHSLNRQIGQLAKKAFDILGLPLPKKRVQTLVGTLYFRYSYAQNQYKHALESAAIAALLASEMGLDTMLAKRGALLHDIGKIEAGALGGSHALIGAAIAREEGEDPIVANAIAAHHGEEKPISPYAYIVAAADAISGARPGARREQTGVYSNRKEKIYRLAQKLTGSTDLELARGGRELAIWLPPHSFPQRDQTRNQEPLQATADRLAAEIQKQLTYPGEIKVSLYQDTTATAIACPILKT